MYDFLLHIKIHLLFYHFHLSPIFSSEQPDVNLFYSKILVFCIPVSCTLDLKKAAHAAGDKKVEMIHMKELLGLTGYIRGGCSPVGMKKKYPTFMDETAALYDEIAISGGARGLQMVLDPQQLMEYAEITAADLVEY